MNPSRLIGLLALIVVTLPVPANGADPLSDWLGVKVLPKERSEISVNGVVVNRRSLSFPLVVQNVNGQWLWVGDDRKGWIKRSQVVTLDEAPDYYTRQIARNPRNAWAYNFRAVAMMQKGEVDLAISDYDKMVRLMPTAVGYTNRGVAWMAKKKYENAIADFNQAIHLDPNYKYAYIYRGDVWRIKKEFDKAIVDLNQAIRLGPNYPAPYNTLGWIRATSSDSRYRNGGQAVRLATKACELGGWKDANAIATLATAYAESGEFEQAMKYQQKAMDLNDSDTEFLKRVQHRLELYGSGKPFQDLGEDD